MPNPVIPADLEARFHPFSADEEGGAQDLLDDAWVVLLARVPDLEARLTAGTVSADTAAVVVKAMVLRVLRNPTGVSSWSLADYSERRDGALSSGELYASDAEVALLTGQASAFRRRAFSMVPTLPASSAPSSESEYLEYLRSGSPAGVWPVPPGSWPA